MKRRGFLGLIGGAVAAGPAVAKNALATTTPLSAGSALASLNMAEDIWDAKDAGYAEMPTSNGNWRTDRIARIQRLLSGEEFEDDGDMRPSLRAKEINIHSLGSVSPSTKIRMLRTAVVEAKRQMRRKSWLDELLHLETQEDF